MKKQTKDSSPTVKHIPVQFLYKGTMKVPFCMIHLEDNSNNRNI